MCKEREREGDKANADKINSTVVVAIMENPQAAIFLLLLLT